MFALVQTSSASAEILLRYMVPRSIFFNNNVIHLYEENSPNRQNTQPNLNVTCSKSVAL